VIERASKNTSRTAVKSRRQEIEQRLVDCGLVRGPRRLFRGESPLAVDQERSHRLRLSLEGLGPVFSSFGLYMSARADLWPARDCLELAKIQDKAPATPANWVRSLLSSESDSLPEERFVNFEDEPFESRLLFQCHYARLNDGAEVIVKIVHPEIESLIAHDLELLPLLKDAFEACGLRPSAFKSAVTDFFHSFEQQMDLINEARAFVSLAQDAEDYDAIQAPQVYGRLCTSQVLVIEKLNGLRLEEIMPSLLGSGTEANCEPTGNLGFEPNEFGRLLCEVWLRQALMGRSFPVEVRPGDILVLPGKQIAFTGGGFAGLPAEPQKNLWAYLLAAAHEDSDKACLCLLKEIRKEEASVRDDVRQRFRQAMPFRDGGWDATGDRQSLAELLFVHWRFASECGYGPLNHLPAFYRGLFNVVDIARRVAPQIDPLAEGVRDLRLLTGLGQFSKMMSGQRLTEQIDQYTGMIVDLPQILDEALTSMSDGPPGLRLMAADSAEPRTGTSSAMVPALLLVLAAFVLVSHYIGASSVSATWANRANTIVFMIFGALLLRVISRIR
jgi:predicted unusual protein kinase regulating ubiquinone biosynthesis (AarF/ABC1/UbiB family)